MQLLFSVSFQGLLLNAPPIALQRPHQLTISFVYQLLRSPQESISTDLSISFSLSLLTFSTLVSFHGNIIIILLCFLTLVFFLFCFLVSYINNNYINNNNLSFLYRNFPVVNVDIVFLHFYPCLLSVLYTGPPTFTLIFTVFLIMLRYIYLNI